MTHTILCERCGAVVKVSFSTDVTLAFFGRATNDKLHLCERCMTDFYKWLEDIDGLSYNYPYMIKLPNANPTDQSGA